jgi:hypothetical protein
MRVPQNGAPGFESLGRFVWHVRLSYSQGRLSRERVKRLERLGFVFAVGAAEWEDRCCALRSRPQTITRFSPHTPTQSGRAGAPAALHTRPEASASILPSLPPHSVPPPSLFLPLSLPQSHLPKL